VRLESAADMAPKPPKSPKSPKSDIELRPLSSDEDFAACVELQLATWGRQFAEVAPGSILKVAQKVGGVAAGAFEPGGRLLGFVFGLTGVRGGRLVHWSHMLAVAPEARDSGLGTSLKLFQRELLLPLAVESVLWTFDPLEGRNAHLNLNRLGAEVVEYVEDMYAGEMGSELAHGIGTDRLIVEWRIAGERARRALAGEREDTARFRGAPAVNAGESGPEAAGPLPDLPRVRIEIPATIQALKAERPEEAHAWRAGTRRAFEHYLGRGYRVAAFEREPGGARCSYGLERDDSAPGGTARRSEKD
jgi:predicted GNAT superfamily acetyltransferase